VEVVVVLDFGIRISVAHRIPIERNRKVAANPRQVLLNLPRDAPVHNDAERDAIPPSAAKLGCKAEANVLSDILGGVTAHIE